jgi:hypothetical protein
MDRIIWLRMMFGSGLADKLADSQLLHSYIQYTNVGNVNVLSRAINLNTHRTW